MIRPVNFRFPLEGLAYSDGYLWGSGRAGGSSIFKINPLNGALVQQIPVPYPMAGLAFGNGYLWAVPGQYGPPGVFKIDPSNGNFQQAFTTRYPYDGLGISGDTLWCAGTAWGPNIDAINSSTGALITSIAAKVGGMPLNGLEFGRFVPIPSIPTLIAPSNSAINITLPVTLRWSRIASADYYVVEVSTSASFSALSFRQNKLTDTTVVVSGLSNQTQYCWRVLAAKTGSFSSWTSAWNFTTIVGIPPAPVLVAPSDGSSGLTTSPTLSWNSSSGAATYHVQVSTASDFSSILQQDSTVTGTSKTLSTLTKGTTCFWRVRAKNINGVSAWSAAWSFTTIKQFALAIVATNGSVTKSPDQAQYDSGTVVTLTATPAAGYQFTGWSGDLTGTTNPAQITMNGAKSVTANFATITYSIATTATNGSVTKSPNQTQYDSGTVVTLTAIPAVGYQFTGWSGDLTGTTNPAQIIMSSPKNIIANFSIKTYALTVAATNGIAAKSPDQALYDSGSVITLTATPAAGYQFTGWSGDLTGTTNPAQITMNGAKNVTANFLCRTNIPINSGWNMISLNVHPQDSSASSIFGSLRGLVLVKNNAGQVYWPAYSVNTIGSVRTGQGYQVYTVSLDTLRVYGTAIDVATTPIALSAGWNMIAYLPQSDMPIETALAGVAAQITIVKNNAGKIYWPDYSVNTIGNMQVGQGYKICMKSAATLTYPSAPIVPALAKTAEVKTLTSLPDSRHFLLKINTGNNATILAKKVMVNGAPAADSSEIGAFDEKGNLIGSGAVIHGMTAFSVWGDNPQTKEKDGCAAQEKMTFKLWNGTQEYPLEFQNASSLTYTEDGISVGVLSVPQRLFITKFALRNVSPNPFRNQIVLAFDVPASSGKDMQDVEINIFNLKGNLIHQVTKGKYAAGHYSVSWNCSGGNEMMLGSNAYVVRMKAGNFDSKLRLFRVK